MGFEVNGALNGLADGPKLYRRPMSFWWWLGSRAYFSFIVRELTCLFVGAYALLTLWHVRAVGEGPGAYEAFNRWLSTPTGVAFNVLAFLFVLYHAVTWFRLVPTTMVVRLGEQRVSDRIIAGTFFAGWAVVSLVIASLILRG